MKFRIVRRIKHEAPRYYAQQRRLRLWVDCELITCSGDTDFPDGAENPSYNLQLVKNYVEHIATNKIVYEYR